MTLLKNLFKKKPKFYVKPEHKVELSFTESNGINNYRFESGFNIPSKRALCAFDYYNEFNMGCDAEFLNHFSNTIREIINDKKSIILTNIIRMTTILEERVKYIRPKNLYLQIAAVATFDETEDPYTFDYDYARKKIERWSKDEAILDFFFENEYRRFDSTIKELRREFKELFRDNGANHERTLQDSHFNIIQEQINKRVDEFLIIARWMPSNMNPRGLTLYEHFLYLRKIERDVRKQEAELKRLKQSR